MSAEALHAAVEEALEELGIGSLSTDEQRVLRALAGCMAAGVRKKALQLARETALTPAEFERVCDALLLKGLIGPGPVDARRLH